MEVPLNCYAKKSKLNKKILLYAFFLVGCVSGAQGACTHNVAILCTETLVTFNFDLP